MSGNSPHIGRSGTLVKEDSHAKSPSSTEQAPDGPRKERIKRPKVNPCPECDQENYLIWPGYGKCQTCLKLRMAFIDQCFGAAPRKPA